jgi:putative transposase
MEYRRARIKGGTYFFTLNTFRRRRLFSNPANVELLRKAFRRVMKLHPFKIDAFVLLPDHLHCIWTLPEEDDDYPTRWRLIKTLFTRKCQDRFSIIPSRSRVNKREQALWQRRYWEHLIRDEEDFNSHVDYIHYNSVKHGWSRSALDWQYSSFHRYLRDGFYEKHWGSGVELKFKDGMGGE